MPRLFILLILLVSFVFGTPAHAELNRAEVEKIVAEYIAANGDELMSSITTWQKTEQMATFNQLIDKNTPTMGPADAPITIVEFSDFECPFCFRAQESLKAVRARYGDRIRWAYKHYPLDFHAKARPAAYASIAAQNQGKFWEYSDELWKRQKYLSDALYQDIAKELKLDVKKFNADRTSAATKQRVDADMVDVARVGARGTPYFLINGTALSGAQPVEAFVEVIEAELAKAAGK